jgi:hypothetical protein
MKLRTLFKEPVRQNYSELILKKIIKKTLVGVSFIKIKNQL